MKGLLISIGFMEYVDIISKELTNIHKEFDIFLINLLVENTIK